MATSVDNGNPTIVETLERANAPNWINYGAVTKNLSDLP